MYPHKFVTKGWFFKRTYCKRCGFLLENSDSYFTDKPPSCFPPAKPETEGENEF